MLVRRCINVSYDTFPFEGGEECAERAKLISRATKNDAVKRTKNDKLDFVK